jgi:5-methylcytosine-specific restriction endonuclease McrA
VTLRRTGIQRGKGLKRGSSLKRSQMARGTTPLPSKRATPRKAATPKPKPKPDPVDDWTRDCLYVRSGGCCEACGRPMDRRGMHAHHRQKRQHGDHSLANLVGLHPNCHVVAPEAVHQNPKRAKERGLILSSVKRPAEEPLVLANGRRVMLDPVSPLYLDVAA